MPIYSIVHRSQTYVQAFKLLEPSSELNLAIDLYMEGTSLVAPAPTSSLGFYSFHHLLDLSSAQVFYFRPL